MIQSNTAIKTGSVLPFDKCAKAIFNISVPNLGNNLNLLLSPQKKVA